MKNIRYISYSIDKSQLLVRLKAINLQEGLVFYLYFTIICLIRHFSYNMLYVLSVLRLCLYLCYCIPLGYRFSLVLILYRLYFSSYTSPL